MTYSLRILQMVLHSLLALTVVQLFLSAPSVAQVVISDIQNPTDLLVSDEQENNTEIGIAYHSKYVSEGREQLAKGGIFWIGASRTLTSNIAANLTYGYASDSRVDYDELDFTLEYANSIADINYSLAYTRLEFIQDSESDDELTLSLEYSGSAFIVPFTNLVYGRESNGFFIDFGIAKDILITEQFSFTPILLVAYDYGYAGESQDGYNHASFIAEFAYQLNDKFTLSGIAQKTFGGSILSREASDPDQFWGGINLAYSW